MSQSIISQIVKEAYKKNASDIHLVIGKPPMLRINGAITPLYGFAAIDSSAVGVICKSIIESGSSGSITRLEQSGDMDVAYSVAASDGCPDIYTRCNIFRHSGGTGIAMRLIPSAIPHMNDLRIPASVKRLSMEQHGLIIISGPTGSGKTTTIASLINNINAKRACHILTIENPIEYRFPQGQAIVSQREIGTHCSDFSSGLKAAMREDPDVILVGELRDADTVSTALAAAETGHLVFATLHAANVIEAIDRLPQYFPASARKQVHHELANSFRGIIAQRLITNMDSSRQAIFEVLLRNDATVNIIRNNEAHKLADYMTHDGMQTFSMAYSHVQGAS